MIEIVQAGQTGKTDLLFEMHRLRARIFKDMLNWDVSVDKDGLEVDEFDIPEAVYLLALDRNERVIGHWRLLSSVGPTMIRDVWPEFLKTLPMPKDPNVFEVSRFGIHSLAEDDQTANEQRKYALGSMFCALTELCIAVGIDEIYTLYDERIAQVIKRINCAPVRLSDTLSIKGTPCQTGVFKTDEGMLKTLRAATGIEKSFVDIEDLPPELSKRIETTKEGGI